MSAPCGATGRQTRRQPGRRALRHLALLTAALLALTWLSATPSSRAAGSFTAALTNSTNTTASATLNAPTALAVGTGATLSWTATSSSYATGTRVLRGTTSGGPYTQIADLPGLATTSYTDSPGSGTFFYTVVAYYTGSGANWTSVNSNEARYGGVCSAPGTTTVGPDADTYTDSAATTTAFGSATSFKVDTNRVNYGLVHFSQPARPSGCMVTGATLTATLTAAVNNTNKPTVTVYTAASAWTEATTWSNQPGITGTGTSGTPSALGPFSWSVTTQVQALYAGVNNGFELRGSVYNGTDGFGTRESTTPETLAITFG